MKIAINRCYGGFSLSDKAFAEYLKRKGIIFETKINAFGDLEFYKDSISDKKYISQYDFIKCGSRNDSDLIVIIEEMGEESFGMFASLKIVEIPDDVEYEITEFDGLETIREKCRTWC
jgi:hypothetical protein